MDKYDRMTDIPPAIERKIFEALQIRRVIAHRKNEPYCFMCDQMFRDNEALEQHQHAKHTV